MPETSLPQTNQPPKIQVILDTNIIKKILDRYSVKVFAEYLSNLVQRNGTFVISDFTSFELIRGANLVTEGNVFPLINFITRLNVTTQVLLAAARLETLYKIDEIQPAGIEIGDKLIAATAILNSALILTANGRDFPWPYFQEVERKIIEYEDKNKRTKCIPVSLLLPDFRIVAKRFNERS